MLFELLLGGKKSSVKNRFSRQIYFSFDCRLGRRPNWFHSACFLHQKPETRWHESAWNLHNFQIICARERSLRMRKILRIFPGKFFHRSQSTPFYRLFFSPSEAASASTTLAPLQNSERLTQPTGERVLTNQKVDDGKKIFRNFPDVTSVWEFSSQHDGKTNFLIFLLSTHYYSLSCSLSAWLLRAFFHHTNRFKQQKASDSEPGGRRRRVEHRDAKIRWRQRIVR